MRINNKYCKAYTIQNNRIKAKLTALFDQTSNLTQQYWPKKIEASRSPLMRLLVDFMTDSVNPRDTSAYRKLRIYRQQLN
jgi:hypothetical protein